MTADSMHDNPQFSVLCQSEPAPKPLSVLTPARSRPAISRDLAVIVWATLYGAVIGAAIASGLWWWLG